MTDKALEAAARVIARDLGGDNYDADDWGVFASTAEKAISAYLSALPGEAEVVAFMHPTSNWAHVQYSEIDMHCPKDGPRPIPLVTLASLQAMQARAEKAEEANKALMAERTSLIETKRQQIEALTSRAEKAEREYEKVLNSYADENQRLSDAAETAEPRVKELVEALEPFAAYIEARDENDSDFPDDARVVAYARNLREAAAEVTVGDFRRARTALKGGSNG